MSSSASLSFSCWILSAADFSLNYFNFSSSMISYELFACCLLLSKKLKESELLRYVPPFMP